MGGLAIRYRTAPQAHPPSNVRGVGTAARKVGTGGLGVSAPAPEGLVTPVRECHSQRPMALRPILRYPDARLREKSRDITVFDDELRTLVADMAETMYDANGAGLA